MKLPVMPVRSGRDATMNFDKMAKRLPERVTVLPMVAEEGQEIYYDDLNGHLWHLRYNAALGSASKWQFLGGVPLATGPAGQTRKKKTKVEEPLGGGPTLTVPLTGEYEVTFDIFMGNEAITATNEIFAALAVNGVKITQAIIAMIFTSNWNIVSQSNSGRVSLTAGDVISVRIIGPNNETAEAAYENARIIILPIRVG